MSCSQTIWVWIDCALMWPELEDLAWLERSGRDLGRGQPVMIVERGPGVEGFMDRWSLGALVLGGWGPSTGVAEANAWLEADDVYRPFFIAELPGDAMPTDYVIDAGGTVRSIERMYRGPWALVVPWSE